MQVEGLNNMGQIEVFGEGNDSFERKFFHTISSHTVQFIEVTSFTLSQRKE
jgi:hypothetical protein